MDRLVWLEWMNAFIVWVSLAMNVIFAVILWQDRRHSHEPYYGAIIGIFVYHLGESSRQAWYWVWGHFFNRHMDWLTGVPLICLYIFGVVLAIGAACQIRVFTETRFGRWTWKIAMLVSFLAATLMVMLPRR